MDVHYHQMWNHSTSTIEVPEKFKNPFNEWLIDDAGNRRRPRTSLEILQEVLHGPKYSADFDALEDYLNYTQWKQKGQPDDNGKLPAIREVDPPSCLVPNLESTRALAARVVERRREQQHQQQPHEPPRGLKLEEPLAEWPFQELVLPLPVINGEWVTTSVHGSSSSSSTRCDLLTHSLACFFPSSSLSSAIPRNPTVGFPKAGSSTLQDYFKCLGLRPKHNQEGKKMLERLYEGKFPLFPSKNHAYCQLDKNFKTGYYPQISLLDEMHEIHPNSTMTFLFRPVETWIKSTRNWYSMWQRFAAFEMPGLQLTPEQRQRNSEIRAWKQQDSKLRASNTTNHKTKKPAGPIELTDLQGARWWCGHVLHMREYVREYPSHALIELDLYDSEGSAGLLHDLFEADTDAHHAAHPKNSSGGDGGGDKPAQCWGHSNANKKLKTETEKKRDGEEEQPAPTTAAPTTAAPTTAAPTDAPTAAPTAAPTEEEQQQ